jgi:exosome complex exonuclease RRP6
MAEASSSLSPASFDALNTKLQAVALKTTKYAAVLPADIGFHRSMDPTVVKELDQISSRVLKLQNRILGLTSTVNTDTKGKAKAQLHDQDDLLDNFQSTIVDSVDQLLERAVRGVVH